MSRARFLWHLDNILAYWVVRLAENALRSRT